MEEILHQWICSLSHYLQYFIDLRWLFGISSINSSTQFEKETLKQGPSFMSINSKRQIAWKLETTSE